MGKTTIEWTATQKPDGSWVPGYTFNPWIGCTKVSPGCKNCYAETLMDKRLGRARWGKGQPRSRTGMGNWKKPIAWNREAATLDYRPKVFCASVADLFDDEVPQSWRDDLWELIHSTPQLDWLLLTKRPQNIRSMVPGSWLEGEWPGNAWLGTTVEDQAAADERIPLLLNCPAPVRFLSCEPLLEEVNIVDQPWWDWRYGYSFYPPGMFTIPIHWIICGGESGHGARPMHPDWARSLRDQCQRAGVPYLFKQWGAWGPGPDGRLAKLGKKNSGRMLDGETWDQFPKRIEEGDTKDAAS